MRLAVFHFALMFLWVVLSDDATWHSFVIGFAIAQVLWHGDTITVRHAPATLRKVTASIRLAVRFVYELSKSNFQVAFAALRDPKSMRPCIVAISVEGLPPGAIALLANMITATPGTTSLEVTPDQRTLYVHALLGDDPDSVRAGIESSFISTIREILR